MLGALGQIGTGTTMHGRVSDSSIGSAGHRARLRQRLFDGGGKALLDHELVEYLLALAIPRRDTKEQAKALIARYGGIGPLLSASADALRREGLSESVIGALKIAEATALRLLETRTEGAPVLSSWDALTDYLHAAMAHSRTEQVRVLFLNAKNMLIANEAMWDGSVDEASVHVREIIARAIALGATALIIVHNHPSGDPSPSKQDIRITQDLVEAARHMKITVHDHVIVGASGRSSLRALGLI
jgi:DNA repair protein RadC